MHQLTISFGRMVVQRMGYTIVGDNLSAHKPSAFYNVFGAEQAKGYLDRLEFIYTPKHGSWLDMAEIELSILQRDCLNRQGAFQIVA